MDETQEKSVIKSDSKEKIGNTFNQLDLLHRLFINPPPYPLFPYILSHTFSQNPTNPTMAGVFSVDKGFLLSGSVSGIRRCLLKTRRQGWSLSSGSDVELLG